MKKYENFVKHMKVLERAPKEDMTNEFIISGIIDKFFIQFELGWKLLKETLKYEGRAVALSGSPREIIKAAYSCYDFVDEKIWLSMLKDRNDMAHIYDEKRAKQMVKVIVETYIPEFQRMIQELEEMYKEKLDKM